MAEVIEQHPVQTHQWRNGKGKISSTVALRAYEVYCHLHGPQEAIVDLEGHGCRGGFGAGELLAFLYAHSFPKTEWRDRVREAFEGMENI